MANVHGFNDNNQPQNRQNRNNFYNNPMFPGINNQQSSNIINQQINNNRVPFLNSMNSTKPPLQQSIPYTVRLVWCPTLNFLSLTVILMIIIWIMYIISLLYDGVQSKNFQILAPKTSTLITFGAIYPEKIKAGQIWRIITAAFLHGDLLHIVMNTLSLLFFMSRLEKCYSFHLMLLLAFFSAICGNLASANFLHLQRGVLSVGASTIIFGVFGGLISYMTINWTTLGAIRQQICCILGIILCISILSSFSGNVDFAGHIGGLVGGYLCGIAVFPGIRPKSPKFSIVGSCCLGVYILVMLLSFYL